MKIYILTLHWVSNFGANLQAYSSFRFFKALGHDVRVIDYRDEREIKSYKSTCCTQQFNAHVEFIEKNIELTERIYNLDGIVEIIKRDVPDIVVVGSDAVWRQKLNENLVTYWLNDRRLDNCKTKFVSLAVSLMGSNINNGNTLFKGNIINSLKKFQYITLRDDWSIKQLELLTKKHLEYSPDPVFLLDSEKMSIPNNEIVRKLMQNKKQYIIISISKGRLYNLWFKIIRKLLNSKGYIIVELCMPEGNREISADYTITTPLNPNDWYVCLSNASGYIGERFHAMVSCINNNVPFVVIDTYGSKLPSFRNKKSKIYDLARRINKLSYIVHKRNPMLQDPFYIYRKICSFIKNKDENEYLNNIQDLKSEVSQVCKKIINQ